MGVRGRCQKLRRDAMSRWPFRGLIGTLRYPANRGLAAKMRRPEVDMERLRAVKLEWESSLFLLGNFHSLMKLPFP